MIDNQKRKRAIGFLGLWMALGSMEPLPPPLPDEKPEELKDGSMSDWTDQ